MLRCALGNFGLGLGLVGVLSCGSRVGDTPLFEAVQLSAHGQQLLVDLSFPKFTIDGKTLNYLPLLGLNHACYYFPWAIFHGATIEVDEKGIKAAGATFNEGDPTADVPVERELFIDRPFLFFVFDHQTNFVLFSGRYAGTP